MAGPAPSTEQKRRAGTVYTIPAGTAFLDALAAGILERYGGDPQTLAEVQVLLPTRWRAGRWEKRFSAPPAVRPSCCR